MVATKCAPPLAWSLSIGRMVTGWPTAPTAESSVAVAAATTVMTAVAVVVCPEASVTV